MVDGMIAARKPLDESNEKYSSWESIFNKKDMEDNIKDNNTEVKESKVEEVKENTENAEIKQKDKRKDLPQLFKPGQSGNPKGKPKGTYSFIPMLKRKLKELDGMTNKTKGERIVEELINKAIEDKDIQAMKEMFNRIDGMPKQTIAGDKENPLTLVFSKGELLNEPDKDD